MNKLTVVTELLRNDYVVLDRENVVMYGVLLGHAPGKRPIILIGDVRRFYLRPSFWKRWLRGEDWIAMRREIAGLEIQNPICFRILEGTLLDIGCHEWAPFIIKTLSGWKKIKLIES